MKTGLSGAFLGAFWLVIPSASSADESVARDAKGEDLAVRYQRAAEIHNQKQLGWHLNATVLPQWIAATNRFWYQEEMIGGYRFVVVDADKRQSRAAFDHGKLARGLAKATDKAVDDKKLPVFGLTLNEKGTIAEFDGLGKRWTYNIRRNKLEEVGTLGPPGTPSPILSPDGTQSVFRRDFNLWVRNIETGEEKQLTTDGEKYFEYGIEPDATGRAAGSLAVLWSPDSKKVLTHQTDDRKVADFPMVEFAPQDGSLRSKAFSFRTSLPGDENVTTFRMTVIDVASARQTPARYGLLPVARMKDTPISGNRTWWSDDSTKAYFIDVERLEKRVHVIEWDVATGDTKTLFSEANESGYVELGSNVYTPASILPLPDSQELIWYSERTGWAHLYLYDLATGDLVRPLTKGNWMVRDVLGIDRETRDLFITRAGHDAAIDPYYRQVVRVNIDTAEVTPLSGGDADHFVAHPGDFAVMVAAFMGADASRINGLSRTGDYYVETIRRVDQPTRTLLRDRLGRELMTVAQSATESLPEWYTWAEPVRLKAADDKTTISAVVIRPSMFDESLRYPVIDFIYGGPQVSHVPETPDDRNLLRASAIAELGFVVTIIDGRGTSERSRAFHEASYGAAHTASNVEDHIAAIRQLADRHDYVDDSRVGITGFSGGGYMTANAMLRFPEFFDVGVAAAGNHDQRLFWSTWGERYHGRLEGESFESQANATYANNLKGKLLFIHGLMDYGVHPAALFQLTQALIDANKDFDLILLPQAAHTANSWAERRLWEYFLVHLADRAPLPDFEFKSIFEIGEEAGKEYVTLRHGVSPTPAGQENSEAESVEEVSP